LSSRGHAVVVGGTRGSGPEVVRRLAADGYSVSVMARQPRAGETEAARSYEVDVADEGRLVEVLGSAVRDGGPVAALVLMQRFRGDGDAWAGELAVSVTAAKTAIEALRGTFAADGASVVVVSSHAARLVAAEQPPGYHVAKAAVRQLARYYAVVLGPERVRVNCVTPGAVAKPGREDDEAVAALQARITPLGRVGDPGDVADAVSLLCDERAGFVTGQELVVDGGLSLLWQETLAREAAGL
jgi:NAD(P)-dependent dehydrogenase (short-subunit alcohol dehydrogenase family)